MLNLDRIYSVRKRKSHNGQDCYAVIVTLPSYEDGVFVEIGGYPVKWVFRTEAQAYADCERRVQEDKLAGTQSCKSLHWLSQHRESGSGRRRGHETVSKET